MFIADFLFPLFLYLHVFFFNDTATTEIYTLSLHDALPICPSHARRRRPDRSLRRLRTAVRAAAAKRNAEDVRRIPARHADQDRKSTRLNSSHANISYAVFCLKKKKKINDTTRQGMRTATKK